VRWTAAPWQPQVGAGLVARGDGVALVDAQQQVALMDKRVVIDIELRHVARNLRGEGDGIAFCVGVVGADLAAGHQPVDDGGDDRHHHDNAQDDQRPAASRLVVVILVVIAVVSTALLVVPVAGPAFGPIGMNRRRVGPIAHHLFLPIGRIGIANCLTRQVVPLCRRAA
jgi:hypothetical protein